MLRATGPTSASRGEGLAAIRNTHRLHAIDLFCGAGGMTQGLRDAGLRILAGVDLDPTVRATYQANHGPRFRRADVRDLTPKAVRSWAVDVDTDDLVIAGCSPCQFWSSVPTTRTTSRAGSRLLLEVARLIDAVTPGYVVVENVAGLAKRGNRPVLQPFLSALARGGYSVAHGVVLGTQYGVPQARPRFLLVASRLHSSVTLPPARLGLPTTVRGFIGEKNGFCRLNAGGKDPEDPWHRAAELSADNMRRISRTPPDGGDRSAWRDTKLQLDAYRGRDGHFRNVYGRMWWDRPAATLTTRFNSISNGRFGHPEEDRAISVREGATLQTFPRGYKFVGSRDSVCRQIGNAVPPLLAKAVGEHLRAMHESRGR